MTPATTTPPARERTRIVEVTEGFDPALVPPEEQAAVASAFAAILGAVPGFQHARIVTRFVPGVSVPIVRQVGGDPACGNCALYAAEIVVQAKRLAVMARIMTRPGGCVNPEPEPENV